jgi:hypothetical protein
MSFDVAFILVVLPAILMAIVGTLVVRIIFFGVLTSASAVGPSKNQVAAEIYAVVLGFIIVYGFTQFKEAQQNVLQEAATLGRIISQSSLAGGDGGAAIKSAVHGYSESVAIKEWPLMANGEESPDTLAWLDKLDKAVLNTGDASNGLVRVRLAALMDEVVARRVERISVAPNPLVSNIIFQLLLVGAALAIVAGWFLRGPSIFVHLILVTLISSSVITMMVLSAQLLYPFSGPVSIAPTAFLSVASSHED